MLHRWAQSKKTQLLAALACLCLSGCGNESQDLKSNALFLTGRWLQMTTPPSEPEEMEFEADGTFEVFRHGHEEKDIWGVYRVDGRRIYLRNTGGSASYGCEDEAVYEFFVDDDMLAFKKISDGCRGREAAFSQPWKRPRS